MLPGYGRQSDGNREIVPREEIEIKPTCLEL